MEDIVRTDRFRPEESNTQQALYAQDLKKSYRGKKVVDGVSLEVHPGQIVGLLGPNGAGKTTSFHMIMGIVKPDGGEVKLGDFSITPLALHERSRKGIGFLAQEPSVFRKLTVWQNLDAILEFSALTRDEREDRIETLLEDLKISHLAGQKAQTLSGGERRRLEIARALSGSPTILMLDEPFSGIDPKSVGEIQDIIKELRDRGIGILITDHNVRETLQVTDFAYIIGQGKIMRFGTPTELVNDPLVRSLYLGDKFTM